MDTRLSECLRGAAPTEHILPFFWQHGEDHETLLREIEAIRSAGVTEFCVESRTHEAFCEDAWWDDFGFILREAEKRHMRVWLLDDKHFPTGYANDAIAKKPRLRMISLRMEYRDFVGPQAGTALIPVPRDEDEEFVSVSAVKRSGSNALTSEVIDLMPHMEHGLIFWDIPSGAWRVFYVIRTHRVCSPAKKNYVDMLNPASCQVMINEIYEPHYAHFGRYFGNTFAGFFSDEPSFGNDMHTYDSRLGKPHMLIPWRDDLPRLLGERNGLTEEENRLLLPALWQDIPGATARVREPYMECVTTIYSKNFCYLLGDWCRAHSVLYIGHVIEDMNTHQRLGYGAGHFFRALDGQDMAGIDIVLNQVIPGHCDLDHTANVAGDTVTPTFFRYMLPKLGSSHAHIQPLKRGRAMCEIYGAFGWAEGIPEMKYLTDLMLSSGINYFVPHAFTPKYPDPDCPPHFYAQGNNPTYPLFGALMAYTHRAAHLLSGGTHQAGAAIYYNAEAEWAGGKYMLQQEVCKLLTGHQVDFDLIPQDALAEASVTGGKVAVNRETYRVLIVPTSEYLPDRVINDLDRLSRAGATVLFVGSTETSSVEGTPLGSRLSACRGVPFDLLPGVISPCRGIGIMPCSAHIRFFHTVRDGKSTFMLWNEDIFTAFDGTVTFPVKSEIRVYDAWTNRLFTPEKRENGIRVRLTPGQSLLFSETDADAPAFDYGDKVLREADAVWSVSLREAGQDAFVPFDARPGNLARLLPDFAGTIRYEAAYDSPSGSETTLAPGVLGETGEVSVNGEVVGQAIDNFARFDIAGLIRPGKNTIRIDVVANMGYRGRDSFSTCLPLPPMGLVGPVKIG